MKRNGSAWWWIPTLYVAEGLPYFAVNTLTVLMYVKMGVGVKEMAFFTGWLYLPWVVKPFWSPFVDIIGTKRRWVIWMQGLIAVCMAAVAFLLPGSLFFATTLACFWLMAFFSATHDIAADGYYMLALDTRQQAAYVGVRSTFYRIASVVGQGGLVMLAGALEASGVSIAKSWMAVFICLSLFFALLTLYHSFFMPRPERDHPGYARGVKEIVKEFGSSFVTFFAKPGIWGAIGFMLLYRLPEAMCIKLVQPFLVSERSLGGLGLSTAQVGFANGTVGVVALLLGGILGGLTIARGGLRKWLWPMALTLTLPCVLYCLLAMWQPSEFWVVCSAIALEQFGYGFGFTAFMLYLIYFSRGPMQTSHYAFCTAFMALGMMIPGMAAGWFFETLERCDPLLLGAGQGYVYFFWWIMLSCVATFIACRLIRIPREPSPSDPLPANS